MRLYIACSLREIARAAAMRALLQDRGHEITARWIDSPDAVAQVHEVDLSAAQCDAIAAYCNDDMDAADACVLLMSKGIRGALVEHGYMRGQGKPSLIVGPRPFPSLMCKLHGVVHVERDEDVPAAIDALPQPLTGAEFIATLERVRARLAAMGVALMPEDLE